MSNHPAIQPRLVKSNVETLLNKFTMLDNTHQVYLAKAAADQNPASFDYWNGYRDALDSARQEVNVMWAAAVTAARATEKHLEDLPDAKETTDLDNLADIAQTLLDLAERLDQVD